MRGRAVPGAHLALRLRLGPAGAVGRCGLSAGAARCCPGPRGRCTTSISLPSPDVSARPPSHPSSCFGGRREMVLQGAGSGAAAPCAALVAPAPARGQPWAPCCSPVRAAPSWLPACHPARSSRGWAGAAGAGSGPVCPNPAPPSVEAPPGSFSAGLLQPRLPPLLLLSCPGGTFVFLNPGCRNNLLIKCINS